MDPSIKYGNGCVQCPAHSHFLIKMPDHSLDLHVRVTVKVGRVREGCKVMISLNKSHALPNNTQPVTV